MVKIKVYIELHFECNGESACSKKKKNMQQRKKDKNKINLLMHGRVKCKKLLIAKDVLS